MQYACCIDALTGRRICPDGKTLPALGNFDGVHSAHRKLLRFAASRADSLGLIPAAWFFDPPAGQTGLGHNLLTTLDEKRRLIADCGIRVCFVSSFTKLKDMPAEAFVRDVLRSVCNAAGTVAGYNFKFGKDARGGTDQLSREFGKNAFIISEISQSGGAVNSTKIRQLIRDGEIEGANALLGYGYEITSEVAPGKRLGASLGFPTANQPIPAEKVIPAPGVYATVCTVDGVEYRAVTDVGVRPTAEDRGEIRAESHIIGYSGQAYGKTLTTRFVKRIRGEIKFDSLDELKAQIKKDIESAHVMI